MGGEATSLSNEERGRSASNPAEIGTHDMEADDRAAQDIDEEGEADTFAPLKANIPKSPTEDEVEEHRKSHIPYRDWCPHCVQGRGLGERRGRHAGRHHDIPRVGIDYWYITSDGLKKRCEITM